VRALAAADVRRFAAVAVLAVTQSHGSTGNECSSTEGLRGQHLIILRV
jgi:hypothetical protein